MELVDWNYCIGKTALGTAWKFLVARDYSEAWDIVGGGVFGSQVAFDNDASCNPEK